MGTMTNTPSRTSFFTITKATVPVFSTKWLELEEIESFYFQADQRIPEEKSGLMAPKSYRQTFVRFISKKNDPEIAKYALDCLKEFGKKKNIIIEKDIAPSHLF